jgi:hypothetical protein
VWGPSTNLFIVYPRLCFWGQTGREVKLTAHLSLVLRLWMSGAVPPLPYMPWWRFQEQLHSGTELRPAWHTNNLSYDQNFSFVLRTKSGVTTRMPVKAKTCFRLCGCKHRPEMRS